MTAAFRVRLDSEGLVENASIVYGGMAPMTKESPKTQNALLGKPWFHSETLDAALTALLQDYDLPYGVPGGMADYRKTLTLSLFFRFWHESAAEFGLGNVDEQVIDEIHREISSGARDNYNPYEQRVVGKQVAHLSALKQCTGEAEYIDDMPRLDRELFGGLVMSTKAHAKILHIDWDRALGLPGVVGYIDRHSIPSDVNIWGSIKKDEPFFVGNIGKQWQSADEELAVELEDSDVEEVLGTYHMVACSLGASYQAEALEEWVEASHSVS